METLGHRILALEGADSHLLDEILEASSSLPKYRPGENEGEIMAGIHILLDSMGYAYDDADDTDRILSGNFLFSQVIDSKRVVCRDFAYLYYSIGQARGIPIDFYSTPDHCFVGLGDYLWESTVGAPTSIGQQRESYSLSPADTSSTSFFRPLSEQEVFSKALRHSGIYLCKRGDTGGKALIKDAIVLNPGDPMMFAALAEFVSEESVSEALALIDRGIVLCRRIPELYYLKGDLEFESGAFEEAYHDYMTTFDLSRGWQDPIPLPYLELGLVEYNLGMINEAKCHLSNAIQTEGSAAAALYLGLCCESLGQPDEARAWYMRSISIEPFGATYAALASLEQSAGNLDLALAAYCESISLEPTYIAFCNRGVIYHGQQRYGNAESDYREAIRLTPERPDAHGNLAELLHDTSRDSEALAEVDIAIALGGDYADLKAQIASASSPGHP